MYRTASARNQSIFVCAIPSEKGGAKKRAVILIVGSFIFKVQASALILSVCFDKMCEYVDDLLTPKATLASMIVDADFLLVLSLRDFLYAMRTERTLSWFTGAGIFMLLASVVILL